MEQKRTDCIIEKEDISEEIQIWHCFYQGMSGTSKVCRLWPGVILGMNDFSMNRFPSEMISDYRQMKINFCMEGRCEVRLRNNSYVYLGKNTLSIDTNQESEMFFFPEGYYKGMEMIIDFAHPLLKELSWMSSFGIDLNSSYHRLQEAGGSEFGIPSEDTLDLLEEVCSALIESGEHLFNLRSGVVRLLRHLLTFKDVSILKQPTYLTSFQRELARRTHDAIFDENFSVTEFARQNRVSASSLENYFRSVYGSSICQFRKKELLAKARALLAGRADMKVSEIAGQCGYRHAGKFAEVFRKETGLTPVEYRRAAFRNAADRHTDNPCEN